MMPKLKPVNDDELSKTLDAGHDAQAEAAALDHRLRGTHGEGNITEWRQRAVSALAISRAFADLSFTLMQRSALAEQRAEIERLQSAKAAQTRASLKR